MKRFLLLICALFPLIAKGQAIRIYDRLSKLQDVTITVPASGNLLEYNGTNWVNSVASYQPLDLDLTSLSGAVGTNTLYYRSGANTWSSVAIGIGMSFAAGSLGVDTTVTLTKTNTVTAITNKTFTAPAADQITLGTSGILVGGTNLIEQRNGTNAQTFRIYGTYTNSSNYERLNISANNISRSFAGTGSGSDLTIANQAFGIFYTAGNHQFRNSGGGTLWWQFNTSGHLLAGTDNTYDIGASGATRPRNLFVGTAGTFGTTVKTGGYTVATLPAGTVGMMAYVTDATAPTFLGALTGGGAVVCPVFYNGAAWVSH